MIKFVGWIIACFFSTYGFTYMFLKLSSCSFKKNFLTIFLFIVGWLVISLLMTFDISIWRLLFYFVFYSIFFYFINHMSVRKIIYYVLIIWFYGVVIDFLIMLVLSLLAYFTNINLDQEIFGIIPTIIVFLIFIIIGNTRCLKKITEKLMNFLIKLKYADFLLIGFTIFVLSVGVAITVHIRNLNIDILLFLVCFLIVTSFILLVDKKITTVENNKFLETLKENNDFYLKMDDEYSVLKHNLTAKLLSIKSVANKKARILIDDMIKSFGTNMDFLNHIKEIPYGLNGLIYQKVHQYCNKVDIKILNEIQCDIFSVLKPRRYNVLAEKLSVSIDNAIESSISSISKILVINLFEDEKAIYVEVKNSFNTSLDLDNIGLKNYSTKGKKHGIGLFSMLRDNEVSVKVKIIDDLFVVKLVAKKHFLD